MNLRCMTNTYCKIILALMALFVLNACGQGGSESGQTNDQVNARSHDGDRDRDRDRDRNRDRDRDHDDDDDDDRGDGGHDGPGGGTVSSLNIIAIHNPNSSQYNDNCLNCHGDIPNAQSLDASIPDAHVAMLPFTPGENSDQCVWCHRDVSNTLIHMNSQVGAFQGNIRKTVDTQLCAICHGPVGPGKQFYQTGITTSADPDGSQLYNYLCSACHRELANSEVKGESTEEIYNAIAGNEGGMGPLSVLNPTWIQAITVALGGDPTLPPDIPAPGTGASLYQQYCANCHGALASSTKTGASAAQIQNGINTVADMSSLSFLTATQVQAIADALSGGGGTGGGGTGGTDGASLYQANCSTCHGDLASSSQSGASAGQIQNAINNDTGGMGVLSSLTSTQIQAIADALSGGGGTGGGGTGGGGTDGASLYQANCSTCHGDLASSSQSGASAGQIQNAINNDTGGMGVLSSLTSTQIQAIADALSGGGGTGGGGTGGGGTGGTDGTALYQSYCSSCHRSLDNSQVSGDSASKIQEAIADDKGGMSSLEFLTDEQINAIASVL